MPVARRVCVATARPRGRFALLNFESRHEDSLSTLLSAPPGTQRLLGASVPSRAEIDRAAPRPSYAEAEVDGESDGGGEGGGEAARAAGCAEGRESLDKERFARFVEGAKSKLPFLAEVTWTGERDVSDERHGDVLGDDPLAREQVLAVRVEALRSKGHHVSFPWC